MKVYYKDSPVKQIDNCIAIAKEQGMEISHIDLSEEEFNDFLLECNALKLKLLCNSNSKTCWAIYKDIDIITNVS